MKAFFYFLCLLALSSCSSKKSDGFEEQLNPDLVANPSSASAKSDDELPDITFEKLSHDFGTIKEGESVQYAFVFTNTGKSDLIIGDAHGSCGCTVPKFPTHPIAPGEKGKIDVEFNSVNKKGQQQKSVTLITNCKPSTRMLEIRVNVIPLEQ